MPHTGERHADCIVFPAEIPGIGPHPEFSCPRPRIGHEFRQHEVPVIQQTGRNATMRKLPAFGRTVFKFEFVFNDGTGTGIRGEVMVAVIQIQRLHIRLGDEPRVLLQTRRRPHRSRSCNDAEQMPDQPDVDQHKPDLSPTRFGEWDFVGRSCRSAFGHGLVASGMRTEGMTVNLHSTTAG